MTKRYGWPLVSDIGVDIFTGISELSLTRELTKLTLPCLLICSLPCQEQTGQSDIGGEELAREDGRHSSADSTLGYGLKLQFASVTSVLKSQFF